MNQAAMQSIDYYRQLDVKTAVADADPHRLIDLLFQGARDRLNQAQGNIERQEHERRATAINSVVEILEGLRASLDHDQGGDIAENLDRLYDYMQRRLYEANKTNDAAAVVEVLDLLSTIRSAWDGISEPEGR